jgi:hypothetical protein
MQEANEKPIRFSNKPLKLKEMIWFVKGVAGDWESIALFLESRCVDPNFDVRDIEITELESIMQEVSAGIEQSNALQSLAKISLQ